MEDKNIKQQKYHPEAIRLNTEAKKTKLEFNLHLKVSHEMTTLLHIS